MGQFDFKGQADISSIANTILTQKRHQEEANRQAEQQKVQLVKETAQAAGQLVASAVEMSKNRQKRDFINTLAETAARSQAGLQAGVQGPMTEPQSTKYDMTKAAININPDYAAKQVIGQAFPGASSAHSPKFQQSGVQIRDKDGKLRTVGVAFEEATGQIIDPFTRQPITNASDLSSLPDRGYAQGFGSAGYTEDGREVVRETRSGAKFVIGPDGEYEAYTGKIFPKLENIPASMTDAIGELNYSQTLLTTIADSFDPDYVGPVAAKAGKISSYLDAITDEQRVEFYANVAEYKNAIVRAITGAQLNKDEVPRIMQQLPDENTSPKAFLAALKRAYIATNNKIQSKQRALKKGGYVQRGDFALEQDVIAEFDKKMSFLQNGQREATKPNIATKGAKALENIDINALGNALGLKRK